MPFRCAAYIVTLLILLCPPSLVLAQGSAFTQEDRERLVRLEAMFQVFMDQTDKRFEDLRADINFRFEQLDKRFEQVDKRFEQVDKRFEQVDRRFEQLLTFMWIIAGIFTAITVGNIGFAYWDRRSSISQAQEETVKVIEKEGRLSNLIQALRELAPNNPDLASALRKFGLL